MSSAACGLARRSARARRPGPSVVRGLALLGVVSFATLAVVGPWVAPHEASDAALGSAYWPPDSQHLLGYDGQGRDILSQLLRGARASFLAPLLIALMATVLGSALALVAAWRGGWVDSTASGLIDGMLAFPGLLLAILAASVFGPGLVAAVLALSLAYVPYMARIVRSGAVNEVHKEYVSALRVQGFSSVHIATRHLLPNLRRLIVGQAAVTLAWATVDIAALSFLGLGVQPPSTDWGLMVAEGQRGVLQGYPTESLAAGLCLILAVCSFIVVGKGIADRPWRTRA